MDYYLGDLVGKMKRSAIDAFMCEVDHGSWIVPDSGKWRLDDNNNCYWGWSDVEGGKFCSRTDSSGEGGGLYSEEFSVPLAQDFKSGAPGTREMLSDKYVERFNQVRQRIDDLLEPWIRVPDDHYVKSVADTFSRTHNEMMPTYDMDPTGGEAGMSFGVLPAQIQVMENIVLGQDFLSYSGGGAEDSWEGKAARSFKEKFLKQATQKITNLTYATACLTGCMGAQAGIWKGVRSDVRKLIQDCTNSFNQIARANKDHWQETFEFMSTVLSLFGVYIPNGKAIMDSRAAHMLTTALETGAEILPGSANMWTFEDVMRRFETGLNDLKDRVLQTEEHVRDMAVEQLTNMENRANYDIDGADVSWTSQEIGDPNLISWPTYAVVNNLKDAMNAIAEILTTGDGTDSHGCQKLCSEWKAAISLSVLRDSRLGLGSWGPGEYVEGLCGAISTLLGNLAEDLRDGTVVLEAAYQYAMAVEQGNGDAIASLAASLDRIEGPPSAEEEGAWGYMQEDWWTQMNKG